MKTSCSFNLEHYKKTQSSFIDDPVRENELRVDGKGKAQELSTKVLRLLKDRLSEGVVVSANGSHATKAVTIVELLKRKRPELQQMTTIKYMRVEDIWESEMEGLDNLKVIRKIPSISMHLMEPSTGRRAGGPSSSSPTAVARGMMTTPPTARSKAAKSRKRTKSGSKMDSPDIGHSGKQGRTVKLDRPIKQDGPAKQDKLAKQDSCSTEESVGLSRVSELKLEDYVVWSKTEGDEGGGAIVSKDPSHQTRERDQGEQPGQCWEGSGAGSTAEREMT